MRRKFKLTPERRRKLKLLIMKKAMEDLKLEAEKKVMQREEYLATKVKPLNLDGLSEIGKLSYLLKISSLLNYSCAQISGE